MIAVLDLRKLIQQNLQPLGLYSLAAEELLVATCAQESYMGKYRRQINGPALGIYQMEPATYEDIWENYLKYHPGLLPWHTAPEPVELVTNDELATCMARVQYLRAPGALPAANDLLGLWRYYKQHYNTPAGAAQIDQFYARYKMLVGGLAR